MALLPLSIRIVQFIRIQRIPLVFKQQHELIETFQIMNGFRLTMERRELSSHCLARFIRVQHHSESSDASLHRGSIQLKTILLAGWHLFVRHSENGLRLSAEVAKGEHKRCAVKGYLGGVFRQVQSEPKKDAAPKTTLKTQALSYRYTY